MIGRVRSLARRTNIGTQDYTVIQSFPPALLLQLTMKRYELEYVTYAIFWISHIRLCDVQIVNDAA